MSNSPPPSLSFDEVFSAEFPLLVKFVKMLGADTQEAEDAAQAALTSYWRHSNAEDVRHIRAYLRKSAEREFYKSSARETRQEQVYRNERLSISGDPVDVVIQRENADRYLAMVAKLPPAQRRVFAWSWDGFTTADIAEHLDQPEATIRSNLRHAREKLKSLLMEQQASIISGRKEIDHDRIRFR